MIRIGIGYDSHRFGLGDHVMLGGVHVPHTHGLVSHSDGDAVLHALTDAILGALGAGDIGDHFPDTDPQWSGAASSVFVQHAVTLAKEQGFVVSNLDVVILAENPKLGPQKASMVARIAEMLDISAARVSVKAKTNEKMGFVGRNEGLAAMVNVLLAPAS